ncbi:unnamed protein product [Trichobilharzia regenti]|nr:unnamed protein product [Trichobilharzia regenti]
MIGAGFASQWKHYHLLGIELHPSGTFQIGQNSHGLEFTVSHYQPKANMCHYPQRTIRKQKNDGLFRAAAPSGASTGIYEANELRDNGHEFHGKGVLKAVNNVNKIIAPALIKKNLCVTEQKAIDEFIVKELDGTPNKSEFQVLVCRDLVDWLQNFIMS